MSLVIGLCLILGPIILVLCVSYGIFGFNPEAAQSIRSAEAAKPVVMEEIRRIHIRSPDRFRHDRLDRHPFYLGCAFAVFAYSICIFAGAKVTSNIAALDPNTKMTMAGSFLIGSTLIMSGSAMGLRVRRWTLLKGIRDNMTSDMLADDIRLPYTFGGAGLCAISISTAIYSTTSFKSTAGSLGGWLTSCIAAAAAGMIAMLYVRVRRYDRARDTLINEAVAQIERGHALD